MTFVFQPCSQPQHCVCARHSQKSVGFSECGSSFQSTLGQLWSKCVVYELEDCVHFNKTLVKLMICIKRHRAALFYADLCCFFSQSITVWIMCHRLNKGSDSAANFSHLSWSLCSASTFSLPLKASVSTELHRCGLHTLFNIRSMIESPFLRPLFSSAVIFNAQSAEQHRFNQSCQSWLAMIRNLFWSAINNGLKRL